MRQALRIFLLQVALGPLPLLAQGSLEAREQAERQRHQATQSRLLQQADSAERTQALRQEAEVFQERRKDFALARRADRARVVGELKTQWKQVEAEWKAECARHQKAQKSLQQLPEGPEKAARLKAELETHRANSKSLAVRRDGIHQGVIRQANLEVAGGRAPTSAPVRASSGTPLTSPDHRGMNGDFDLGGGRRTTEKVAQLLNEIGVPGPRGGPVSVKAGVLETAPDFAMTINVKPGHDPVGSAGHQAQVSMAAGQKETYISQTGGAVKSQALQQHLSTLDHTKKAFVHLSDPPASLVGGTPEGQALAKGTLKAAAEARLPPEMIQAIAKQQGWKNPEALVETLAAVKADKAMISSAEEAAKLQSISRDILNAAQAKTAGAAQAQVSTLQSEIASLEQAGQKAAAQVKRAELADYQAKAKAAGAVVGETVRAPAKAGPVEPQGKGTKIVSLAGLALGGYGLYEGYQAAKQEMEAKKQSEGSAPTDSVSSQAQLAVRTFWHGLGFSGMAEIGKQAGQEVWQQYQKDILEGKVSPDSWSSYLAMKGKAVFQGLLLSAKAMTYDSAKASGTQLGTAVGEGVGAGKDLLGWLKNVRNESKETEANARTVYDKLLAQGASPIGAQRAADLVRKGDYSEARRLAQVLAVKRAKLSAPATPTVAVAGPARSSSPAKKKPKVTRTPVASSQPRSEQEADLRSQVSAKLAAKGLPAPASLVDRLVRVLQRDGLAALDAEIAELGQMQGNFSGTLAGKGSLKLTVTGGKVSGTYAASSASGGYTANARGTLKGSVDLVAGTISCKLTGSVSAAGVSEPLSVSFQGRFNGRGYSGKAVGNGVTQSWSVAR